MACARYAVSDAHLRASRLWPDRVRRLLLIRHATTSATRRAAFPVTTGRVVADACAALDAAGVAAATTLASALPRADRCWTSYARRATQTAECLRLTPDARMAELAEGDFGRWAGATLDEVHARDPDALATWLADPGSTPHGGEPLREVRRRARRVLDAAADADGTTVAVSHGGLIKAALLEVLALPDAAVWRLDCAPASVTELNPDHGWRITTMNWTPAPSAWIGSNPATRAGVAPTPAEGTAR